LVEHGVEVCANSVGESKCAEAAYVRFVEVEGLFVGRGGHDVMFVFVGVGAHVCVKNADGANGHDPCRVVVSAEAFEGDARAYKSDKSAKEVDRGGEVLSGLGWAEG